MSSLSRGTAALAAAVSLSVVTGAAVAQASPAAPSPSPSVRQDAALYGGGDPTHDGVWRQSFALLALDTAGVEPAESAVEWLVEQQCADGGWASFRPDVTAACTEKSEDTNATAAAVQALAALGGHGSEIDKAVDWLVKVRNRDGGWAYNPGSPTDANSTAIVLDALEAARHDQQSGRSEARKALRSLQIRDCAVPQELGAYASQPDKQGELRANDSATTAVALSEAGGGLPVEPSRSKAAPKQPTCEDGKASGAKDGRAAVAYLLAKLEKNGYHLNSPQKDGGPDFATTADTAMALAAHGQNDAARKVLAWLREESAVWSKGQPAALADLILATSATGGDPRDFGGADLVKQLVNLGPEPVSLDSGKNAADGRDKPDSEGGRGDEGGLSVWYTVALGLLIGIGGGFLISTRRKQG